MSTKDLVQISQRSEDLKDGAAKVLYKELGKRFKDELHPA